MPWVPPGVHHVKGVVGPALLLHIRALLLHARTLMIDMTAP
jgi:hypothetical protein